MTFDATVNPVVYEGGVPVFIDTEYDTWNNDKNEADTFVGDDSFYNKVDELLDGRYIKRINDAVEKESKALNSFIELLKSEEDQLE